MAFYHPGDRFILTQTIIFLLRPRDDGRQLTRTHTNLDLQFLWICDILEMGDTTDPTRGIRFERGSSSVLR